MISIFYEDNFTGVGSAQKAVGGMLTKYLGGTWKMFGTLPQFHLVSDDPDLPLVSFNTETQQIEIISDTHTVIGLHIEDTIAHYLASFMDEGILMSSTIAPLFFKRFPEVAEAIYGVNHEEVALSDLVTALHNDLPADEGVQTCTFLFDYEDINGI